MPTYTTPDGDTWVTTCEVARLLKVNAKSIRRYHRESRLDRVRVQITFGGHRRYHLGDLHALAATLDHKVSEA